jgi:hypothetical protein
MAPASKQQNASFQEYLIPTDLVHIDIIIVIVILVVALFLLFQTFICLNIMTRGRGPNESGTKSIHGWTF